MNSTYIALLANFGILAMCGLLVTSTTQIWRQQNSSSLSGQILSGSVFGATAATLILLSTAFVGGAVFDSRAAPAILSGVIGGPWAALITAIMGSGARLYVGGDWAVNGVLSVWVYCASGAVAGPLFRKFLGRDLSTRHLAPLTAVVTCVALSSLFIGQPFEAAAGLVEAVFGKLIITNTISVFALGLLVMNSTRTAADREQLLMMRAAVTRAANGVTITDASDERRIIFANDAAAKIFGYEKSELLGRSTDLFFGPETGSARQKGFRRASRAGREVKEIFVNFRKNGEAFHNQVTITPIFSSRGEIINFLGIFSDVTEEVKSRSALKTMAAQIPIALIYTDLAGDVEYINDAAADLFGVSSHAESTRDVKSIVGPDLARIFAPWIDAAVSGGEVRRDQRLSIVGNEDIEARLVFAPTVSEKGDRVGVIISIEDITVYKQMEAALAQSQRLQSIGTLTGGIAHDFNNLNTVVIGNLDLLKLGGSQADNAEFIDEALAAAKRGAKLTQSLLSFGRQAMLLPDRIDLAKGLPDLENLVRSSIRNSTQISFVKNVDMLPVDVDQTNLESAILNLVVNADHAIGEDGGEIRIEFHEAVFDTKPDDGAFAGDFEIEPMGRFAAISVSDDGPGVPKGVREKIIEPFFTTKGRHSGAGLGLAMVHGFVRQSGGFMRIAENTPRGVVVSLFLPISADAREEVAPSGDLDPSDPKLALAG